MTLENARPNPWTLTLPQSSFAIKSPVHSTEFSSSALGGSLLGGGEDGGSSLGVGGFGAKVVDGLAASGGADVDEEPEGRSPEEVLGGRAHSGCKTYIDQFKQSRECLFITLGVVAMVGSGTA